MKSVSHLIDAAYSISAGAFQPMARTAKLSMPSRIFLVGGSAPQVGRSVATEVAAAMLARKERRFMVALRIESGEGGIDTGKR